MVTRAHFVVYVGEQRAIETYTLCAAIKRACQCIGAHHLKLQSQYRLMAFLFWIHHYRLTIKSGNLTATIKKIGVL